MNTAKNIRPATTTDALAIGQLLYAFNQEYDEPTPSPEQLSDRFKMLLERDDTAVLLGGDGPGGIAVLRFRPSIWSQALECYLAELYVKPNLRGQGLGRALMNAAVELARDKGADYMDVSTSEDDVAARKLYESSGFTNHESGPDGPIMYTYELEL
jgi:ribosomal protein S18 acetylase RimI-like enzyme